VRRSTAQDRPDEDSWFKTRSIEPAVRFSISPTSFSRRGPNRLRIAAIVIAATGRPSTPLMVAETALVPGTSPMWWMPKPRRRAAAICSSAMAGVVR